MAKSKPFLKNKKPIHNSMCISKYSNSPKICINICFDTLLNNKIYTALVSKNMANFDWLINVHLAQQEAINYYTIYINVLVVHKKHSQE